MAKKRNIVLVINDLKGNGAERVVITLASGFCEAGHSASIVCFKRFIELPIPDSIPVFIFSGNRFRWLPRFIRGIVIAPWIDRFIKKEIGSPDLVLSNLIPADRIMAYSRLPKVHFIIHNTLSSEMKSYFTGKLKSELAERKKIYDRKPSICVSRGVEKDLREFLGDGSRNKIKTIPNPVDEYLIRDMAEEKKTDIISDAIIHVGKFKEQKRQDRLIRAYHISKCSYPLVFIGQGELLPKAKELVKELNLESKVYFLGFRKNPYPYIKAARLLVLCSDFEGLGMVLLEALTLGTAAISSNCQSGPSEVLPSMNLFKTDDIDDMVQVLKRATENPISYTPPLNRNFLKQSAVRKYLVL